MALTTCWRNSGKRSQVFSLRMKFSKSQNIVLASGNRGKIKEIQAILEHHPVVPQDQFQVQEVEETGTTFVENAISVLQHVRQTQLIFHKNRKKFQYRLNP